MGRAPDTADNLVDSAHSDPNKIMEPDRSLNMGMQLEAGDEFVPNVLSLFNTRFGISNVGKDGNAAGGIAEIAALQKEFAIFRQDRSFVASAGLLGLGGQENDRVKERWFELLGRLPRMKSDEPSENGDDRIVNALIANLEKDVPLPCYMKAHDGREEGRSRVIVTEEGRPLFYLNQRYLVISIPMRPDSTGAEAGQSEIVERILTPM
jgi:hypothetical protein